MATLTTQDRKDLPKSDFGIPSEKRFPMPDKGHARNALARLNQAKGLSSDQKMHIIQMAHDKLKGNKK